jgi:hypothetical protein
MLNETPAEGKEFPIVILGDKGKTLQRTNGDQISLVITDWTKVSDTPSRFSFLR